jgi:multiple antibiotic resistance protein
VIQLLALLAAAPVSRLIGVAGAAIVSRVMGMLLAALAVSIVLTALGAWLSLPQL